MKQEISREKLERIIGWVDDDFAARIVDATTDEAMIAQAMHDIESGETHIPASPAYWRVRDLLEARVDRDQGFAYFDLATD